MANVPEDKLDQVIGWRQNAMQDGAKKVDVSQSQITNLLEDTLKVLDIPAGNKASDANKKKSALLRSRMNQDIEAFVRSNKRDPSYTEMEEIMNRLKQKVVFDKGFWHMEQSKYGFELKGDEQFQDVVVPEEEKSRILSRIQEKYPDTAVSDQQIKQIYSRSLKRGQSAR